MTGSGDYISREAAFAECDWYANEFSECEYAIMPLKGALEILPAADVRPVVLCRECKYSHPLMNNCKKCSYWSAHGLVVADHDFCSHGERMEEN